MMLTCPSYVISKCCQYIWKLKSNAGYLWLRNNNKPELRISIDHVVPRQPGLELRVDGHYTNDWITGGCVFVDNLTKYNSKTSLDGDQTLAPK